MPWLTIIAIAVAACLGFALCAWLTAGRIADVQAERARELSIAVDRAQSFQATATEWQTRALTMQDQRDATLEALAAIRTTRSEAGRKAHRTRRAKASASNAEAA